MYEPAGLYGGLRDRRNRFEIAANINKAPEAKIILKLNHIEIVNIALIKSAILILSLNREIISKYGSQ